ncbi:primosomal protein N' [Prevotella sp. PINT]|uniref:replication restart helicase PriA n=1 Tax=Palleniella intestinalis TaxID=2736291 RepID=UPI00155807D0|nr:primosomal protein N' [Palleniella intestinalis]NPD82127.1 primosomal protein N' [Palleniella intestinalis]
MKYIDCILPLGVEGLLTYSIPEGMEQRVCPFVRLLVPLGKSKTYTALAVRIHDEEPKGVEVKAVIDVLDEKPVLLTSQYDIWKWMAEYYICPIGDIYRAAMPAGLKQEDGYRAKTETWIRFTRSYQGAKEQAIAKEMVRRAAKQSQVLAVFADLIGENEGVTKEELMNTAHATSAVVKALIDRGILETYEVPVGRLSTGGDNHMERIKPLSEAQTKAYDEVNAAGTIPVLLQGVTGSGKTEIYIHLIRDAVKAGKQVLYILPEIALTVQIMQRLQCVFGDEMGIYHSKYSDAERVEIWQKQLSDNPYKIILGARSAVLLPFTNLGLIIIDEEHDPSFKQQDPAPRYHARSVAMMLAKKHGAKVVLGTATPSMESFNNALSGKFRLVQLTERYRGLQLPKIEIVNTADMQRRKMMYGPFSPRLVEAMKSAISDGKQVILFLNRRGFAPIVECRDCGWVPKCENCDVSLTMHKTTDRLTCHYCGYTYQIPKKCPSCFCTDVRDHGYGTEKVEEKLMELFPEVKVARMDLDTTRTKNAHARIIADFSAGKTNVLIGTQMVSKGLDFGNVSVVGIVNADSILNTPDFRAYERGFQMLSQVSGRAGRKEGQGLVILQTKQPDVPVIGQVVRNDYRTFYKTQCEERQMFKYPPFYRLIYVYLRHAKDPVVETAGIEMAGRMRQIFGSRVLGPDRPSVARVKSMNIRKIVLKLEPGIDLPRVRLCLRQIRQIIMQDKRYASLQVYYDVDPQ